MFYGKVGGNGAVCAPVAVLRRCATERPKREGGLFYGEVGGNGAVCAPMAALRLCGAERPGW